MPRSLDVPALKRRSASGVAGALNRYNSAHANLATNYLLMRWIAMMTAVEIHATWERYVEQRLVAAINHDPRHFLRQNSILGVTRVSAGLAQYIVRGGARYFDFGSMGELLGKADAWLSQGSNPFRALPAERRNYIDALAAIRNYIVHRSDAATKKYKTTLRSMYNIHSAPKPDEFLHAVDHRVTSPARYQSRLNGLGTVISEAIQST